MKVKTRLLPSLALLACLAQPAAAEPLTLVALGDSLTAGYGLAPGQSFPEQLEAALRARGRDVAVVNAGVSGDTAAAGLARLDWSVPAEADAVIVALGANDALRGLDPAATRRALAEIVARLKQRGQAVLVAGMKAPRNLGEAYAAAFDPIFADVAEADGALLHPFLLEDVATIAALNQGDGLHPTAEGVARMVDNILPKVEELLRQAEGG